MLKKISHILFAVLMLVSTMGLTISKHYCGGNLKSVSIVTEAQSCCDIPTGCCHNENFTIKVEDDFSASSFTFDFTQLAVILPIVIQLLELDINNETHGFIAVNAPPPPKIKTVLSDLQTYWL